MKKKCPYCFVARIAVLAGVGVFLSFLKSTEWFMTTCSNSCNSITDVLLFPAAIIGSFLGSGSHAVDEIHFSIGIVVQLWVIWTIGVWVAKAILSKKLTAE